MGNLRGDHAPSVVGKGTMVGPRSPEARGGPVCPSFLGQDPALPRSQPHTAVSKAIWKMSCVIGTVGPEGCEIEPRRQKLFFLFCGVGGGVGLDGGGGVGG